MGARRKEENPVCGVTLPVGFAIIKKIADDSVLTDGLVDYDKLQPILYDCSTKTYHLIGPVVGKAFHDGLVLKK